MVHKFDGSKFAERSKSERMVSPTFDLYDGVHGYIMVESKQGGNEIETTGAFV